MYLGSLMTSGASVRRWTPHSQRSMSVASALTSRRTARKGQDEEFERRAKLARRRLAEGLQGLVERRERRVVDIEV